MEYNSGMKKKKWVIAAMAVMLGTLGLVLWGSMHGQKGHATPQAAQELAEIRMQHLPALVRDDELPPELVESMQRVVEEFLRTENTRFYDEATGFGILHIACIFKKNELARCLLIDGADPNGAGQTDDSPLLLALGTALYPDVPTQQLTELADTLLAAGASFERATMQEGGSDFLTQAAYVCENEDAILYLIRRGAKPDAETAQPLALHGWNRALAAVLDAQPQSTGLAHALAKGAARYAGNYLACLELLAAHGANLNADEEGAPGHTPLFFLAQDISGMESSSPLLPQALAVADALLKRGADPYRRAEADEDYPGFCPYDFLAMAPESLHKLQNLGHKLDEPPLSFSDGVPLLSELCRAAMRDYPAEQLAEHAERIAAALAPSPEMQQHELYPHALACAISLLARCNAEQTAERLLAMPLLSQSELPRKNSEEDALSALISALRENTAIVLPKDRICALAEKLLQAERPHEAAELTELLARCPDAQEEIERCCADARLPLRAGGYAAKLYAEGLPDARNNGVADWMSKFGITETTPFLDDAIRLTSQERLWFGQMPEDEQKKMLDLMRKAGADEAVKAYEFIIRNLDKPEQLDALMERGRDWVFELEAATARYFLEHKKEFLSLKP